MDDTQNTWDCYMGSFYEKPSTLDDDGRRPTTARLRSYGRVGLEKNWYNSTIFLQFLSVCFHIIVSWRCFMSSIVPCSNMPEALILYNHAEGFSGLSMIKYYDKQVLWSTGSLLVGRTFAESDTLKGRVKQLSEAGLKAEYLCSRDLSKREPDLLVDKDTAAAFLPDDCQLDAHRTVTYLEKVCILGLFFSGYHYFYQY